MTTHTIINSNSNNLSELSDKSVDLIITSPPYPMIEMWDDMFSKQDSEIGEALSCGNGNRAFELMHSVLDDTWKECDRVLKDNGFACINIGDATRTINGDFQLYSNHTKIINSFIKMGYSVLPDIHWRKQSNSPNKFMGSGMYPAGAYVTYEHEYILIFRKGGKRVFKGKEKEIRQKSAFFWEERNVWFSDLWEIKGTTQNINKINVSRERNASFPLEIPYRLINMYSAEGDVVLDPFAGLGTTNIACMLSNRNSIGVDIDDSIVELALDNMNISTKEANKYISARISRHLSFINSLPQEKKDNCYVNAIHGFKVKTRQETAIEIEQLISILRKDNTYVCQYGKFELQQDFEQLSLIVNL